MLNIQATLAKIGVGLALLVGTGFLGYREGVSHQKAEYADAQTKANEIVVEKNDKMQEVSDKTAEQQIVYKDRIVTQFKTIEKEVIKYEETPASNVYLDPEFIRLHNNAAAAHDEVQIASTASGTDGTVTPTGVTTGEAIGVISRNYEDFYECKVKLSGWQKFYSDLQKEVSK
jgi:hypothetical protein